MGLYVIFNLDMTGFSKISHHIIKIAAEVFAPEGTHFNNINFHSLVQPPGEMLPIITQFMGILNGDMADCQEFSVVGK